MKYFSAFTGIGAIELAMPQGWECAGYSEIEKNAIKIYETHFPTHKNYGDITKINADELSDFDFFFGGFPCQAFSIAGRKGGFEDTRGTLFFDVARILRAKRPRYLLLENVKGLLSHEGGRTYATIKNTLDELGYITQRQTFNSRFYTGQNRQRVYILGHLGKESFREALPIGTPSEVHITSCETSPKKYMACLTTRGAKSRLGADTGYIYQDGRIREPSPLECERLQGFPDGWTEGITDVQRYKCLGNSITVDVARAAIKEMF